VSFQIECPDCGLRPVWEFHFGGEVAQRPAADAEAARWVDYIYNKTNTRGPQLEWWFHRSACKSWLVAERDTRTNRVTETRRSPLEAGDG